MYHFVTKISSLKQLGCAKVNHCVYSSNLLKLLFITKQQSKLKTSILVDICQSIRHLSSTYQMLLLVVKRRQPQSTQRWYNVVYLLGYVSSNFTVSGFVLLYCLLYFTVVFVVFCLSKNLSLQVECLKS